MENSTTESILLADANILIDFLKADMIALEIICKKLVISVPQVIIQDEVKQLSINDAKKIGIKILEANIDQLMEANSGSNRISFYDKVCLILSRDYSFTCISNDKRLHTECNNQNVGIIWGLDLLLLSIEKEILSKERGILCFSRIQSVNKRINQKIEDDFFSSLNGIFEK